MNNFTTWAVFMGTVKEVHPEEGYFTLQCRSGDVVDVFVEDTTAFTVLRNLDGLDRDRLLDTQHDADDLPEALRRMKRYVWPNGLLTVEGILYEIDGRRRFEARRVHLLHHQRDRYLFEDTHWWLTQISRLADEWLDDLFGERRSYQLDDFAALYRTNLNVLGQSTDDNIQEMATLSRLIYGLSSAYLLTGCARYLEAARAGVAYQRTTFRKLTHDAQYCFWLYGRRRLRHGTELIEFSMNADDFGTYPLYEQIYALAGLTQYYRITCDPAVLEDIRRTVHAFNDFYLDEKAKNSEFPGHGGYFSHLDYATMRPDHPALGDNQSRKNWNSIGDHIPAYLLNLILALEPLPLRRADIGELQAFLDVCKQMLRMTSELIADKFPDPDPTVPYVRERFMADWSEDAGWRWQRDRAVVGHNLKIAWNLSRVANYYRGDGDEALAKRLMDVATRLADRMAEHGVDQTRGGCFDAVQRRPRHGLPIEFAWGNTKDFWQQEQAILAYLILHGCAEHPDQRATYLRLAREMNAFWNLYFLDHDSRGIFFRTTENGQPVVEGSYGNKGGHSVSGYHAFELNFLAHLYIRAYVATGPGADENFVLYFWPDESTESFNVLPDSFPPGAVRVHSISINGVKRRGVAPEQYQVELRPDERGREVVVEFLAERA